MTIYLIHFERKHHHAQHYIGFTDDLPTRIEAHKNGKGARLMQVIREAQIKWSVVRTWSGTRQLERILKKRKNSKYLCPVCNPNARKFMLIVSRETIKGDETC